jgi:ABC-type uncharacterized transport system involved in gliding motility auxiliary subunit
MAKDHTKTGSSPAAGTAARQRAESLGFLAIVAGILIALNVLGIFFFFRFDATRNRAFTLAEGSRRVVRELEDDLTITAYFTPDLPPPFNATERYVRDILAEYEAASGGRVHVRIVHPDEDEEREEAERAGVQRMQHQRLESDRVSVVEGYRGLVFEYLGDREVIPALPQDTSGLEYTITTRIKQLVGDDLPIGVLRGHEGPTPTKGLATLQRMLPTYELREVDASQEIDGNLRALLIVDPQTELTETELRRIDQYVMRGRSLGVFGGSMKVSIDALPSIRAEPSESGINRLIERWGVRIAQNIVADWRCEHLPLRTSMGFAIQVPYPPGPVVTFTPEQARHPALFRLPGTQLFFTSSIETTDRFRELEGVILMESSEESWALTGDDIDLRIRDPRQWNMRGPSGPFPLAVAIEGTLPSAFADRRSDEVPAPERSEREVRLLVVGTATMLRDEFLQANADPAQLAGAMAFPLNAIDWLAQDSDLIAIRAKTIDEPALEVPRAVVEATEDVLSAAQQGDEAGAREAFERRREALAQWDRRKNIYRWGNTLLIPLLVAVFGIVRWQMRQRKKATLKL